MFPRMHPERTREDKRFAALLVIFSRARTGGAPGAAGGPFLPAWHARSTAHARMVCGNHDAYADYRVAIQSWW